MGEENKYVSFGVDGVVLDLGVLQVQVRGQQAGVTLGNVQVERAPLLELSLLPPLQAGEHPAGPRV